MGAPELGRERPQAAERREGGTGNKRRKGTKRRRGLQPAPTFDKSRHLFRIFRFRSRIPKFEAARPKDVDPKSKHLVKIFRFNLRIWAKFLDSTKVGAGCSPLRRLVSLLLLLPVLPSLQSVTSGPSLLDFGGSRWFYPELARARLHTADLTRHGAVVLEVLGILLTPAWAGFL